MSRQSIRFTEEQRAEFKDLFDMFDQDRAGTIGKDEFRDMMKTLGVTLSDRELEERVREVDESGDNEIDFEEMLGMMAKISQEITPEEEVMEAFKFFDKDSLGVITKAELARVLNEMGEDIPESEAERMLLAATGGKPDITFEEFSQMLQLNQQFA
eukprot:CAMPEP_0204326700 /NCGR_PEP_ID=MMETSP0469-20131031/12029_1 /ASSEMBLY_ACC=CAM_ASM_000384 /TAXON_ID=2969 /ORGANISM="Oxyrrhis marina" /LENGTH=155 /DNA_ID=CAMNT_0051308803 /DNA_START=14 /DNA_END=481 /DNA_ORIENTATION=-